MHDRSFVLEVITQSTWHMHVVHSVSQLGLSDWLVGAGFIRNAVWDCLHDYPKFSSLSDIDVIFYDATRVEREHEADAERQLREMMPGQNWSVCNQARMHTRNGDQPYASSEDAMGRWLETPTCVGVRIDVNDDLSLVAPHGIDDLVNLDVRPTPSGLLKPDEYRKRIESKNWVRTWPRLSIHVPA